VNKKEGAKILNIIPMANSTGKLDKLIEEKVDQKIRDFSKSISDQVRKFLKDNGDYSGEYLYQAQKFTLRCSVYQPEDYCHRSLNDLYKNIKGGLELTVKDKMITNETKDLLTKVSLLS
jgi:hypothetical protein